SRTFARRRRAGSAVVLFTVIVLDGKLATRLCRTPLRSCEARTRTRVRHWLPDAHIDAIFIRRIERYGAHAGRSVGNTQDGTSDSGDAPGTDAAADPSIGCLSGGRLHRAVLSCGGRFERPGAGGRHVRQPFVGTAACPSRA
ncbi:hypothetical protein, partial [Burkholderia stabilis]